MKKNKLDIFLKISIIIIFILLAGWLTISLTSCISTKIQDIAGRNEPDYFQGFGMVFAIFMVYSLIFYGTILFISVIILIISIAKKSKYRAGCIVATILPIVCEIIYIVTGLLLANV